MVSKDIIPSKYQQAIYDYVINGTGHLVVEAAAGSGKTTTLIKCLDYISADKKALIVAFNKDIVKELEKRTRDFPNVHVRTLHSLGLAMLTRAFPSITIIPDEFKYNAYIRSNIKQYSSIQLHKLKRNTFLEYQKNIKKYIDFGRCYLIDNLPGMNFIEDHYGIDTIADEKEVAIKIMEWGKQNIETIDYTDMVWLPKVLRCSSPSLKYDYIMVDECQDMNKAERELVLKCFKDGTRMISVGDANQMVYSYAGADPDSFNALKSIPNTITLPLSISYRCSPKIVDFAKSLVPSIESDENDKREGLIKYEVQLDEVKDGDMVLCRNNAPLIQVYTMLLQKGKKARIMGKDISVNLKSIISSFDQTTLNPKLRYDGLFARLYDNLFTERDKLMETASIDKETATRSQQIQNKIDTIKALEVLSEGINTTDELVAKIDAIFPKRSAKDGIILSTVHKAKGLEADNVYIVCNSLMPSKSAEKDWEKQQEHNLMYVAYTRAKNILGFIDEKGFEEYDTYSSDSLKNLDKIEETVRKLLKKPLKHITSLATAKTIAESAIDLNGSRLPQAKQIISIGDKSPFNNSLKKTKIRIHKQKRRW